ncbi:MAG: alpha/beta hydrolase family protein [Silvibacterium sp.]|nr:alpha/beta hydrolase family protein [Silvibacterium sp.]MBV8632567.1 alpha/beta hydrolase family protein [Silvibacterium sp.]
MLSKLYARWMYRWETALTTRDENRVVRPVEWGFDWLEDFIDSAGLRRQIFGTSDPASLDPHAAEAAMAAFNQATIARSEEFFSYTRPTDFQLETRLPQLFPTNVRPETLRQDAELKRLAAEGRLKPAEFLRFTSPVRTPYPENDLVNARWYPAPPEKMVGKPKQAMIVMPHWNADAFSHNALCALFNRFGISALRLSKPFHDIRRPADLERADYAVSSNIGRTIAACRQAVIDIRCCLDWLEEQGYEQFGILGTSLGSCYAFIASAHDERLRVNAFNHASKDYGDVVWTGQSTRHIRQAFEEAGMTQARLCDLWSSISPVSYATRFAALPKKVLVVYAKYDLTFLPEYSLEVIRGFTELGIDFVSKVLPCGHYTTGETPYKFIDGWYLGSFVYGAFRNMAVNPPASVERTSLELAQR